MPARLGAQPMKEPALAFLLTDWPAWMNRAACGGMDPELWSTATGDDKRFALEVCAGCDVRQQCLDYAITKRIHMDIWGGATPTERKRMKKEWAA